MTLRTLAFYVGAFAVGSSIRPEPLPALAAVIGFAMVLTFID